MLKLRETLLDDESVTTNSVQKIGFVSRILPDFAGFSKLGPGEMYRVPTGYPGGYREGTGRVPAVCIFAENAPYRASKKVS